MADGTTAALDAEPQRLPAQHRGRAGTPRARFSSTTTSSTGSRASCRRRTSSIPCTPGSSRPAAERIRRDALATPVTPEGLLRRQTPAQELGGPAYLVRLAGAAISLFAARDYAQLVYDLAIRRELILIGQAIADRAGRIELHSEAKDQIVEAEQALYQLGETGKSTAASRPSAARSSTPIKVASAAYERDGGLAGLLHRARDHGRGRRGPGGGRRGRRRARRRRSRPSRRR